MSKKILCTLLCIIFLFCVTACAKQTLADAVPDTLPDSPNAETPVEAPPSEDEIPSEEDAAVDFYTQDSEEYRELYANNAIESALDEQFNNAMSIEDFDALSETYAAAWKGEYHALMAQLISLYPDDAGDLEGLRDYTDSTAQEAYDAAYAQHIYVDEDGNEQPAAAAEQNGNFALAEVYKNATVLSILNDYREQAPYSFHYESN